MNKMKSLAALSMLAAACVCAAPAQAQPVVYTLRTVADGQLGGLHFTEALLTLVFKSDTRYVRSHLDSQGGVVYQNDTGTATVSVTVSGNTTTATFAPGELNVRYNTRTGAVSFGSPISPYYPISLGCANVYDPATYASDCASGDWGTQYSPYMPYVLNGQRSGTAPGAADVAAIPADAVYSSPAALALPANLSQSTLLTGSAHTCAVSYTIDPTYGFLVSCPAAAPRGLHTDRGAFYLQDQQQFPSYSGGNMAALRVEVVPNDE